MIHTPGATGEVEWFVSLHTYGSYQSKDLKPVGYCTITGNNTITTVQQWVTQWIGEPPNEVRFYHPEENAWLILAIPDDADMEEFRHSAYSYGWSFRWRQAMAEFEQGVGFKCEGWSI